MSALENQYAIAMFFRDTGNFVQAKRLFESLAASPYAYDNRWYVVDSALQAGEIYLQEGKNIDKSIEYIERYKAMNNNAGCPLPLVFLELGKSLFRRWEHRNIHRFGQPNKIRKIQG